MITKANCMHSKAPIAVVAASIASALLATFAAPAHAEDDNIKFEMVRSPGLCAVPGCVPNARAKVRIEPPGPVEEMRVRAGGLPPNTDFVIPRPLTGPEYNRSTP